MQCPVCDVTLVISSREGIEIDHCPQCRGVWLDRGELDKIIERAAPSVVGERAAPPPIDRSREWDDRDRVRERDRDRRSDHRPSGYDDRPYKRKKRGSFLEDLFDFD